MHSLNPHPSYKWEGVRGSKKLEYWSNFKYVYINCEVIITNIFHLFGSLSSQPTEMLLIQKCDLEIISNLLLHYVTLLLENTLKEFV